MALARSNKAVLWRHCFLQAGLAVLLAAVWWAVPAAAHAQAAAAPGYKELWAKGEYQKALDKLNGDMAGMTAGLAPTQYTFDHAQLLASVGRIDDAIKELRDLSRDYPDPVNTVALALLYRYRGRLDDYHQALADAARQAQNSSRYVDLVANAIAVARMLELEGNDPKLILTNYLGLLMQKVPDDAAPLVAAGDLSYRKYGYDVAAEYYGKALKLEPEDQEALAGLAECYWKSDDPRLEETVKKLLDLNPNAPRAKAIAIEKMLDLGNADDALELIQTQLAIDPLDLHFLALKAAAQFLKDDAAGLAATRKTVLDFNPHYSEVYALPGRVASRHYRFKEAVAMLTKAMAADPDDHVAQADLAFNLLRVGDQVEGRKQLDAAFKADPFNVHSFNMLQVMDTIAKFKTIKDGPFVIQLPADDADVLGPAMLETLKTEARVYQEKYDIKLTTPVLVQMFDDHDQFMVRSIGLPGNSGHLGICFGQLLTLDSPRARPPGAANWRDVLWHEFVHVITLQKTHNRMPRWLSEGISVYEESQGSPAWGAKLDIRYAPIVAKDGLPKLADMEKYFTEPKSPVHLLLGYYLAGEFARFYIDTYGIKSMNAALDKIGAGAVADAALIAASGASEKELNAKFLAHLEICCAPLKTLPAPLHADALTTGSQTPVGSQAWIDLPSSFTEALRFGMGAAALQRWDEAEKSFLKADAFFPDFDGPDAPLHQLADLYEKRGQTDKEEAMLRRIVDRDGTALADCNRLITLLFKEKRWNDVTSATALAFNINPFDVDDLEAAHQSYVELKQLRRALAAVNALAELDKPHAVDYKLERARLMLDLGEKAEAKQATVALLEEMPYYWEAQQLLLKIVDASPPGEGSLKQPIATPAAGTAKPIPTPLAQ